MTESVKVFHSYIGVVNKLRFCPQVVDIMIMPGITVSVYWVCKRSTWLYELSTFRAYIFYPITLHWQCWKAFSIITHYQLKNKLGQFARSRHPLLYLVVAIITPGWWTHVWSAQSLFASVLAYNIKGWSSNPSRTLST